MKLADCDTTWYCRVTTEHGMAVLSVHESYRYLLTRSLVDDLNHEQLRCMESLPGDVVFIMLNPSTATAAEDDPTIRRCIGFARKFGGRRLVVVNLFGLRATDPRKLQSCPDPVGPNNIDFLRVHAKASLVIAAWGANASARGWQFFFRMNGIGTEDLQCLGKNDDGSPRHPLYLPAETGYGPFVSATEGAQGHARGRTDAPLLRGGAR